MALSNLPPGVTESMIPGNRAEDVFYEQLWDTAHTELELAGYSAIEIDQLMSDRYVLEAISDAAYDVDYEDTMVQRVLARAADVDLAPRVKQVVA